MPDNCPLDVEPALAERAVSAQSGDLGLDEGGDWETGAAITPWRNDVIQSQIRALQGLPQSLEEPFRDAVLAIASAVRPVAVTGMGKSGHVARKIAATLASTGRPAVFVHPAEAAHGDMGMLDAADVVLALSHSGDTMELRHTLEFCRRENKTVIGITSNPFGILARDAAVALVYPLDSEACPNNLAPTTSSALQMALGDALAMAASIEIGFTPEDFHRLHPAGALGKRLRSLRDVMRKPPTVTPGDSMASVLVKIAEGQMGCVLVKKIDGGAIIGVITDGDLRRFLELQHKIVVTDPIAREIMTINPKSLPDNATVATALQYMRLNKISQVLVTNDAGHTVGVAHLHDCLGA